MQNKYSEFINKPNNRSDKIFFEHKENQSFKNFNINEKTKNILKIIK